MPLIGVSLTAADPQALAAFYQTALGFTAVESHSRAAEQPPAAARIQLRYGDSQLEILGFDPTGRAMPPGSASNDIIFQHFAMIVNDIDAACEKLNAAGGFTEISLDGPVKLPAASGGVIAFKFRDPEGHPLEFLQLLSPSPPRIDHTAIVVRDTQASVDFYAAYGLTPHGGSLNFGPEQAALDALDEPVVRVTRLTGAASALALELLCYHQPAGAPPVANKASNDAWATRLLFTGGAPGTWRDPDGHDIVVVD